MNQILLIEDDIWLAQLYQNALQAEGQCEILHAKTAHEALDVLDKNPGVVLIILDMFLPEHNGIEFLHEIASYDDINKLPVIVLTSVSKHDLAMNDERWKQYGVEQYLYKPATKPRDLVVAVKKQLIRNDPEVARSFDYAQDDGKNRVKL